MKISSALNDDDTSGFSAITASKGGFRFVSMLQEDHRQPVYGVQFCYWFKTGRELFATTGSNRVSVYECDSRASNSSTAAAIRLLWAAHDENASESYYSVAWGVVDRNGKKDLILAVAGLLGVIRITSVIGIPKNLFRGHGGAVNELLFHPIYPHILFSASKDLSIRMWDCQNAVCLGRLGGVAGHRDEVLTLDVILPTPSELKKECKFGRLVSGSLDHMICVWNLDSALKTYDPAKPLEKPSICQYPLFSTLDLHADYVDCCRYLPALGVVASRAAKENCILLWRPLLDNSSESPHKGDIPVEVMNQLEHRHSALWWLKFGADASGQLLAAGSQKGRISVWRCNNQLIKIPSDYFSQVNTKKANEGDSDNGSDSDENIHDHLPKLMNRCGEELRHPKCESAIRQVAVSKYGNRIISVSDEGRLFRWDLKAQTTVSNQSASSASTRKPVSASNKVVQEQTASRRSVRGRSIVKSTEK